MSHTWSWNSLLIQHHYQQLDGNPVVVSKVSRVPNNMIFRHEGDRMHIDRSLRTHQYNNECIPRTDKLLRFLLATSNKPTSIQPNQVIYPSPADVKRCYTTHMYICMPLWYNRMHSPYGHIPTWHDQHQSRVSSHAMCRNQLISHPHPSNACPRSLTGQPIHPESTPPLHKNSVCLRLIHHCHSTIDFTPNCIREYQWHC